MKRKDPEPLPWVRENPDPDLSAIPEDVLKRLCAARDLQEGDDEAMDSLIFWAIALGDCLGQPLEALGYDDVILCVRT